MNCPKTRVVASCRREKRMLAVAKMKIVKVEHHKKENESLFQKAWGTTRSFLRKAM